jgi:hypothetical protein
MACVLRAAEETQVDVDPIIFRHVRYFEGLGRAPLTAKGKKFNEEVKAELSRGPVYSFIGGTRYLSMSLRLHPQPYDFVLRSLPDLPVEPGTEVIPLEAMRTVLRAGCARNLKLFERVVAASRGPVYHFEPPPPPRDPLATSRVLKGREDLEDLVGVQRWLRYKLWRLHSEIVREHTEECGAVFVERPDAAVDEDGFLLPEFIQNHTHANPRYGELVLEQIKTLQ